MTKKNVEYRPFWLAASLTESCEGSVLYSETPVAWENLAACGALHSQSRWLGQGQSLQTSQVTATLSLSFSREMPAQQGKWLCQLPFSVGLKGVDLAGYGA